MSASSLVFTQDILAVSGFEYALEQPLFPGKILLWTLFMLSLLTWAIMVSKAVSFFRMRRADAEFDRQFRAARQPLQLFERNYADEMSMQWVVYEHGSHEAAFQMLGSPARDTTFGARLSSAKGLTADQMNAVRDAFDRGQDAAATRIRLGLPILSAAAAGAPFLGLLGMVWILMKTFSSPAAVDGFGAVSPGIAGGLAVMVVALLVSTPAIFAQILFAAFGRERLRRLGHFKEEALRLMDRFYGDSDMQADAPEPVTEEEEADDSSGVEAVAATSAIDYREGLEDLTEAESIDPLETEASGFVREESMPAEFESESAGEDAEAEIPVPLGMIVDEMVQDEMPLTEIESPFEAVEDGFLESEEAVESEEDTEPGSRRKSFETPFTEPEINPIAQQTAGLLAGSTA